MGQLTHYFHQIADSSMLGHFGEASLELAAIGIAGLYAWILNTFLWPLSAGVQALAARRYGNQGNSRESREATGAVLDNGIVTALYAALLAFLFSLSARPLLTALINNGRILELALSYITVIRWSLLPTALFFVIQGFFGAINKTRYVMYSGLISNLLNIVLNWIFIFGKFGFPVMGIRGAALGTALSFATSALFMILLLIGKGYRKEYGLLRFDTVSRPLQGDIVRVALPPAVQNIIALGIFMIYQTLIESYSPVLLAATHAIFSYFRLNKTIISGFARSAAILAGNALGRGDKEDAQRLITAAGQIAAVTALLVAAATVAGRTQIAAIFTTHPETVAAISRALLFFLPFYFIEALGYAFEIVFTSNGYGRWVLFSEFTTNIVFILGATLLLRHLFPGEILYAWLSFGLYQLTHALLMAAGYFRRQWLHTEVDSAVP